MSDADVAGQHALILGVLGVFAAIVALVLVIVLVKLRRIQREERASAIREPLTEWLLEVISTEDVFFEVVGRRVMFGTQSFSVESPGGIGGDTTREVLATLLATISGPESRRLIRVLEEAGYVAHAARMLRSRASLRRARGCMILGGMASSASIAALTDRFLHDRESIVRIIAAEALGAIGDPQSVALLAAAVRSPDIWPRMRLANVLAMLGAAAVPELTPLLLDPNSQTVEIVLDILIDIGILDDVDAVRPLLEHPSSEVRSRTANYIGRAGAVDAIPELIALTADEVWFVRVNAIKALGRIGVPRDGSEATTYFAALTQALTDDSWWVRAHAAETLALGGERGALLLAVSGSPESRAALQSLIVREGTIA